ncbi:hypothetical protein T459_08312 [Capsicum annuum]|uniref:CCHC-type domain-containing protein n=1 Tax=Capsicum annuum TaxID=4072 RepID=A0A2G2ZW79_CAPAN|nr:hypothetical protein T459_08312 [Capsicum annuum]
MEFYDKSILEKIGKKIGHLLKIDTRISSTLRGRYARICVQIPMDTPVRTTISIGDHSQPICYEGEGILCTRCSRLGHIVRNCDFKGATTTKKILTTQPHRSMMRNLR